MGQNTGILYIFTCKCASRHSGVQFFDMWTSKSAPNTSCFLHFHLQICVSPQARQRRAFFRHLNCPKSASELTCFVHFDDKMCFSPQRRAFFRHLIFKKCSEADMFSTFSLQNVLFATAACNFWFLSPLSTYLRTRRFNRPTFRLTRHTNHWKNTAFRDFSWTSLTFAADVSSFSWLSRLCIFFLPTWLPVSSAFQLSILSEVCYLNFLRWVCT